MSCLSCQCTLKNLTPRKMLVTYLLLLWTRLPLLLRRSLLRAVLLLLLLLALWPCILIRV